MYQLSIFSLHIIEYIGRKYPTLSDLNFLRFGKDIYRLLPMLRGKYQEIGATLRIQHWVMESIETKQHKDRMGEVFKCWDENAAGLDGKDRYPHTWQGLSNILNDSKLIEIRNEFFDFLNRHAWAHL